MFLRINGYADGDHDEWVNTDNIESVKFDAQSKVYSVRMVSGSDHRVSTDAGMRALEDFLGSEPHERHDAGQRSYRS